MQYLTIPNLDKHQHYKDRRPPWIKLHAALFDDYEFQCLQDASKLHLILLWLLASQLDNHIPFDSTFIQRRLGITSPLDLQVLIDQGFIELGQDDGKMLAPRKQSAIVETETETEKKQRQKSAPVVADLFEVCWSAYPKRSGSNSKKTAKQAFDARIKAGIDPVALLDATGRYAKYCDVKAWIGTDYVMQGSRFYGPGEEYTNSWDAPERPKCTYDEYGEPTPDTLKIWASWPSQ